MKIIISHGNTDFDGLAGMVAAQKLHPDAVIALRGSEEPQVNRFLENPFYSFPARQLSTLDLSEVEEVIVVDFSRVERLGSPFKGLDLNAIRFTLYDHHSGNDVTIPAADSNVEAVGAVTTLLVEKLLKQNATISKMEATLFALGIYEDTGMLSHVNTTVRDVRAVAQLLEMGADLKLVQKFLRYELTADQIRLFNSLVSTIELHTFDLSPVAIARASCDDYIADAAVVIQKIMEIEGHLSFFGVIRMAGKIHVIGRSRNDRIDVGAICGELGGGGHPSAGAACLNEKTEVEVTEHLIKALRRLAAPHYTARDIMTADMITIGSSASLHAARDVLAEHNINVLPILENGTVIGTISRAQIDRALGHKLRGQVTEFMRSDFSLSGPDKSIREVEDILMSGVDRAVLVGTSRDAIEGIITRMDLFRRLYLDKLPRQAEQEIHQHKRSQNMKEMLEKRLPDDLLQMIQHIRDLCESVDEHAFLVGGIVRDLLLNIENTDVDILVSGNAITFARQFAGRMGGRIHPHKRFGTAVAILPDGSRIDFASARRERYASPGALPEVRRGGLRADLFRRDFTINAMAVALHPREYGLLIDYFGGRRDLHNKTVRILHNLSFIDDPTRVLRALRFAARFGFSLSNGTRNSLRVSLDRKMLWRVSGTRIRNELSYVFESGRVIKAVELFDEHGVLTALHGKFTLDRFTRHLLENLGKALNWFSITFPGESINPSLPYLMALMEKLNGGERSRLATKLQFPAEDCESLVKYKKQVKKIVMLGKKQDEITPSAIAAIADSMPVETIIYAHAFSYADHVKAGLRNYLTSYRTVEIAVDGDDLARAGLEPGPVFSTILSRIRDEVLDGRITTAKEQLALAKKLVKEEQKSRAV